MVAESAGAWTISAGPDRLEQGFVDGTVWLFWLARGEHSRTFAVVVTRWALLAARAEEPLPVETRDAIATSGRSEAEKAAAQPNPPAGIALGNHGELPPPPELVRLTRG